MIKECGVKGIIELLVSTLSAPWLEYERIGRFIAKTHQIRLI